MDEVYVKEVLPLEQERKNYQFVARNMRVDDVSDLFSVHPSLEAALVTAAGKETESLLGISTRWDIMHLPKTPDALTNRGKGQKNY